MKRFLLVTLLTVTASCLAFGQTLDTKIEGKTPDEAAIRKLMKDLEVAWNSHDGHSFSDLFAEDADFTNWRGTSRLHGREEIKKMNANLAVGMFRKSTMTLIDTRIRFFAPDVAAVHCDWDLVGAIDYDGKGTIPPRKYFPLFIVTKDKGNWTIAVMHNLLFQPLPPGAIIGPPTKQ
jgi:uncharacterized protein (TIGR02246 family)